MPAIRNGHRVDSADRVDGSECRGFGEARGGVEFLAVIGTPSR
jgi:hypothetical protein